LNLLILSFKCFFYFKSLLNFEDSINSAGVLEATHFKTTLRMAVILHYENVFEH